jgi:hypothetical protein
VLVKQTSVAIPMYKFWHGPFVGLTVSHVWSSFSTCLFLEFGRLTPGNAYTDRRGQARGYQPKGEWSITSMDSWPAWWLRQRGKVIVSYEEHRPLRLRALRLLIGRRLHTLAIDQPSKATRLTFSLGLELETKTDIQRLGNEPHWRMRGPSEVSNSWPHIALGPGVARPNRLCKNES